jgi:Holliday junction resolvase
MKWAYGKGSRAERELTAFFIAAGYSAIRAAGSGTGTECPDLLLFRKGNQYAIECKAYESERLALDKDQFEGLLRWEENTGIMSYVAWRKSGEGWRLIPLPLFKKNEKSYSIPWETANIGGRKKEELI